MLDNISILGLLVARMGSKRLPGKTLIELAGDPVIVHIFRILREVKNIDEVVVATTTLEEDDAIVEICIKNNVKYIRGSVHDVLDRFRIAIEKYQPKHIVRITGDNPLLQPSIINRVIREHIKGKFDYTSNNIKKTYPYGMYVEIIKSSIIEKVWKCTSDRDDHEHVTLYIRKHPELFKTCSIESKIKNFGSYRLTLDTPEDYQVISAIYNNTYNGKPIPIKEIINFLDSNPSIRKLNSRINQTVINGIS